MDRLLVVDGMNLLFQMFCGMPARIIGANGKPIQGTLGFIGALLKIIRRVKPTHVTVLFDGECGNPRRELDAEYKADREDYSDLPEEEIPFSQLPDIYRALDHMQMRYRETTDCEADDWMAGYALRYGKDAQIVIATQDSDLWQMITPNVTVFRYRGERSVICDERWIREKLGIEPGQYADFKALTGDHSDHIPGAPKVGPKTAAALIRQFGTLEEVLSCAGEITKPSVRESIMRHSPRLRLNKLLIQLDGKQELPFEMAELTWQDQGWTTMQVLHETGLHIK